MSPPHLSKDHILLRSGKEVKGRQPINDSRSPTTSPRGKIRLYSNKFCPYAQRVHLVLDAKKIPYETININLTSKPDWFYDKSPMGKVPALEVDNGDVLYESYIIADYLDEKYHQHPLHSKDPLQKAKDRLLIEQFNKIVNTMYRILKGVNRVSFEDDDVIVNGLRVFESELANRGTQFFGGRHPGMLDYMIWPWCERADLLRLFGNQNLLRKDKYTRLMQWKNHMCEDAAVKKSMLDSTTHIKFLHSQRAGMPDYDAILSSV